MRVICARVALFTRERTGHGVHGILAQAGLKASVARVVTSSANSRLRKRNYVVSSMCEMCGVHILLAHAHI